MAFLQRHVILYVPVVESLWDLVMKNEVCCITLNIGVNFCSPNTIFLAPNKTSKTTTLSNDIIQSKMII